MSRVQSKPQEVDFQHMKRIYRYLKGTPNYGIFVPKVGKGPLKLEAFSDASYASGDDFKSTTGYAVFLGRTLIAHATKKQKIITDSSCYAEMIAVKETMKVMEYIIVTLEELKLQHTAPVINVDNSAVIDILYSNTSNQRSRHFNHAISYVKSRLHLMKVVKVHTDDNYADVMTKQLPKLKFQKCRDVLMKTHEQVI